MHIRHVRFFIVTAALFLMFASLAQAVTYAITPNPATVSESVGSFTFTITRSGGTPAETIYASTTTTEGYSNGSDYTGIANQSVTFTSGQVSKTVTVTINNDTAVETSETFGFIVQRNSSDPVSTYLAKSTFTITDNDVTPTTYAITPNPKTVSESVGSFSFTITRSGGTPAETIYASTTTTEGYSNGSDYTGIADQSVSFTSGQASKTVTVTINDDSTVETSETFGFIVQRNTSDPVSTYLAKSTFTITDNDVTPTTYAITPNPATVSESVGSFTFTITRSGGTPAETIYASTSTTEGYSNGSDYTGIANQSVTFTSGQASRTVTVTINDDTSVESSETFGFIVQRNSGDPVSTYLAKSTFTVTDNDVLPTTYAITPNPATVSESVGSFTFTITRSGGTPAETIYASTSTTEGYSNGSDYTGIANQSVIFTSGQASRTVTVTINDDTSVESSETFGFIVQRNSGDPVSTYLAKSTFTITDNDVSPPPSITSVSPTSMVASNGNQTFTINGSSFQSGASLIFDPPTGANITSTVSKLTYVSNSQLVYLLNNGGDVGTWTVKVHNPDGQSSGTASFTITAAISPPSITSVSPTSMVASNGNQTFTINGSSFQNGATLTFDPPTGANITSTVSKLTYVSSSQLVYLLNNGSDVGTWTVKVNNPDGQSSGTSSFTITAAIPPPSITSVSPTSMVASNGNQTFTINGSSFQNGATLTFDPPTGANITSTVSKLTYVSSSQLVYLLNNGSDVGTWTVRVNNPDGQASGSSSFTITAAVPIVTVTSPNGGETVPAGSSLPISWTVSGNTANISGFWIQYSTNSGSSLITFMYGASTARSTTWAVPSGLSSSQTRIRVFAFDASGTTIAADSSDSNFAVTAGVARPIARPDCNNRAPEPNASVRFEGGGSSAAPGYSIASYAWDFGDNHTGTSQQPTHSFECSGTYQVTLTVTDSGGLVSFPKSIAITVTGQALGTPQTCTMSSDPVNLATGNFIYDHTDLSIPGIGFPFEFKRFYNSKDSRFTVAPLGYGWTHSYNLFLSSSNGAVNIVYGDGRSETYTNSSGVYMAEAGIYKSLTTNALGAFVLTTKEQTRYNFNTQGRLASIMDKNSNTLSVVYDGGGALTAITNSGRRVIAFVNDASNRITRIVDPLNRTNAFAYSAQGDLISATDPRGGVTCFGYDSEHQMTNAVDPNGNQFVRNVYSMNRVVESQKDALGNNTSFTYDFTTGETVVSNALGHRQIHKHDDRLRIVQITDEAGKIQNFEYDDFNNRTKVIDKNSRTTSYAYDAKGNVISKIAPPEAGQEVGNTTTIAYDALNNPTNRVDAKAGRTSFVFDNKGNLTKTVNPQSFTNTITYSSLGLPLAIRDANGNTHSNSYDTAGNLISTRDALGYVRNYTYDSAGRKTVEVEPNGATNRFTYDGNNNLTQSVDPLGFTNVFSYDANNNQILIQDAQGSQTTKSYDPKDRLVSVRDALGGVTSNAYDALDRKIVTIDPLGNATRFAYDPVGNLLAVTNALGQATRYTYDPEGNQLTVMNARGLISSNEYDALNRLIAVTDPLAHRTCYAYDELGRRTQVTDANSQVTRFQYDILGRLTNVIDAATGTVAYTYDNVGNRKTMKEPNGHVTSYFYDKLNRLSQRTEPRGFLVNIYDTVGNRIQVIDGQTNATNYAYDLNKRLTNVTYQVGPSIVGTVSFTYDAVGNRTRMTDSLGTTTYAYDALNRMTNCTDSAGKAVTYQYDANGNRSSMTYPGNKVANYTFDSLNRMVTVRDWLGGVTSNAYDSAGNLALIRNPNGTTASYNFDDAGRLTSLTNALPNANIIAAYNLSLDGVGNHLQSSQIEPIEPIIPTQNVSYAFDDDNRLTNATGTAFTYDVNGNMLTQGADTFAYDLENRLTNAVVGGIPHQYQYDGIGNRLRATRAGITTKYILDVNGTLAHVLAEADASGTITAYYVYGRGLVSKITAGGTASYYHFDVRGSTVALTDSGANLTDKYAYDPFGTVVNSAGTTANPFKYVGRYGVMDEGNGLAYIRARYYSPSQGRFVTKDPITGSDGDSQSLNRFIYALNNPFLYVDTSGFFAWNSLGAGLLHFGAMSGDIVLSLLPATTAAFSVQKGNFVGFASGWFATLDGINNASKHSAAAWENIYRAFTDQDPNYDATGPGIFDDSILAPKGVRDLNGIYRLLSGPLGSTDKTIDSISALTKHGSLLSEGTKNLALLQYLKRLEFLRKLPSNVQRSGEVITDWLSALMFHEVPELGEVRTKAVDATRLTHQSGGGAN